MTNTNEESSKFLSSTQFSLKCSRSPITLRIKSTTHPTDLTINTLTSATVIQLKDAVRVALGKSASGRYLRLIASGRLLVPDTAGLEDFRLTEGGVVHAVIAAPGVRGGQQAALSRSTVPSSSKSSRHRYNGPSIESNGLVFRQNSSEEDNGRNDDGDNDLETGRNILGFDRLRTNGMTRSEITALRTYFSQQVDSFIQQRNRLQISESNTDADMDTNELGDIPVDISRLERLHMEDEWMGTQGQLSEFRLNLNTNHPLLPSHIFINTHIGGEESVVMNVATRTHNGLLGTDKDFIWGFILGFLIGFFMMFWVWIPTVPHKQKLGILMGICFQMAINVFKNEDIQ